MFLFFDVLGLAILGDIGISVRFVYSGFRLVLGGPDGVNWWGGGHMTGVIGGE